MRSQKHTAMWERKIVNRFYNTAPLVSFFLTTQLKLLYIAHGIAHENRCDKLARLIRAKSKISLPGIEKRDAGRRGERSGQGKNEKVLQL